MGIEVVVEVRVQLLVLLGEKKNEINALLNSVEVRVWVELGNTRVSQKVHFSSDHYYNLHGAGSISQKSPKIISGLWEGYIVERPTISSFGQFYKWNFVWKSHYFCFAYNFSQDSSSLIPFSLVICILIIFSLDTLEGQINHI